MLQTLHVNGKFGGMQVDFQQEKKNYIYHLRKLPIWKSGVNNKTHSLAINRAEPNNKTNLVTWHLPLLGPLQQENEFIIFIR